MWKDYKTLRRISESISGWSMGDFYRPSPYYIRCNGKIDGEYIIEYTTEKQPELVYPDELFMTSAGEIDMYDEGEFGGELVIGGKHICSGNFSHIFEHNGIKYVFDDLKHMFSYTFRFIRVNDDGTVDVLYDADEFKDIHSQFYGRLSEAKEITDDVMDVYAEAVRNRTDEQVKHFKLDLDCSVGLDGYCISKDKNDNEVFFLLCSGIIFDLSKTGLERYKDIAYLLQYNPKNTQNTFTRVELPSDKVKLSSVSSIWSDGEILAIGCDKQVVIIDLENKEVEYRTEYKDNVVVRILKSKHKWMMFKE